MPIRGEDLAWRSKEILEQIFVSPDSTLLDSLPVMDKAALQVLLVVSDSMQLKGIITDGNVRRALFGGLDLKTKLSNVMTHNPKTLPETASIAEARTMMQQYSIRHIPLVDGHDRVKDLVIWSDCFATSIKKRCEKVVIMAGGKGTRLDPFTKILPKPMIPLGDKPIIEVIMDKFCEQGFSDFILSVGYKADIIKLYFSEDNARSYSIKFIEEKEPLGICGALGMLQGHIDSTFLVTNCDIIAETDYENLLRYHYERKNHLTILGALKDFIIPYGVLDTSDDQLVSVNEKPNFHFLVNTGVYALEPEIMKLINNDEFLNMTDLIIRGKEAGYNIGVFPFHGKWFDIGQWEEYRETLRFFEI